MKKFVIVAALAGVIATYADAQSVTEKTGVNAVLGITPKTTDFIREAAMTDMFEIEAAKIAQSKGDPGVKKFAAQVTSDHTKTGNELKSLVPADLKSTLPTALDEKSTKKLDTLRNTREQAFASQFDPMQVSVHKDAVSLFERYAQGGDYDRLKDWARKTLPMLKHHLDMAQQLDDHRSK